MRRNRLSDDEPFGLREQAFCGHGPSNRPTGLADGLEVGILYPPSPRASARKPRNFRLRRRRPGLWRNTPRRAECSSGSPASHRKRKAILALLDYARKTARSGARGGRTYELFTTFLCGRLGSVGPRYKFVGNGPIDGFDAPRQPPLASRVRRSMPSRVEPGTGRR